MIVGGGRIFPASRGFDPGFSNAPRGARVLLFRRWGPSTPRTHINIPGGT